MKCDAPTYHSAKGAGLGVGSKVRVQGLKPPHDRDDQPKLGVQAVEVPEAVLVGDDGGDHECDGGQDDAGHLDASVETEPQGWDLRRQGTIQHRDGGFTVMARLDSRGMSWQASPRHRFDRQQ